jgi:hypothetical protein
MPRFNRKSFFDKFKTNFDSSLEQSQVDGIEFLLDSFESEPRWTDPRHIAYALATIYHETAGSMEPVEEGYYLGSPAKVKAFQKKLRYFPYFGRGYVQLTWKKNYDMAGKALGINLSDVPSQALEPEIAFQILTLGMFQGWFTGKKLADYITLDKTDYVGARAIINGKDRAGLIAGYARNFETILKTSAAAPSVNSQSGDPAAAAEKLTKDESDPTSTGQPSITNTVEQKTTLTKTDGETTQQQQTTVTADKNVAVEKETQIGFFQKIKLKLVGWFTFLGGLTGINQYKQQIDELGLPGWIVLYAIYGVLIAFAGWLIYECVMHVIQYWLKRKRTEKIAELNSTPTNTVTIVSPEELDKYQKMGWIVIRRDQA